MVIAVKWARVKTTGTYSYTRADMGVIGRTSLVFSVQARASAHIFLAEVAHNHAIGGYEITIEEKSENLTSIR